jgi:hypothetical protein
VIGGFLVAMGLPLLTGGAAAAAGTAAAGATTVGAQVAVSMPTGYTTVKFVLGLLITML